MEEFFAVVFIECMIENNRCFSEKDFYNLLATQRLDSSRINFNELMEEVLIEFEISSYEKIDNIWQPKGKFISHKAIHNIIDELDLHLEVENSFPVDFGLDVDLLDKQYYKLGNLDITPQNGIAAGVVDDKGYPIQATKSLLIVKMPRDKAELLKKSGYVAIGMKIKGNGKMQRLFDASKVNLKSRIQFEYEVRN